MSMVIINAMAMNINMGRSGVKGWRYICVFYVSKFHDPHMFVIQIMSNVLA